MTSLVGTVEHAVRAACLDARDNGGEVRADSVVAAIVLYCKLGNEGELERVVDEAYTEARRVWGNAWRSQPGDVAERVCDGLRAYVAP